MDILIKNVTGDPVNEGLIWELSRAGFRAGCIVRDVVYDHNKKVCYWSSGTDQCVAYIGETCLQLPKISHVHIYSSSEGGYKITAIIDGKKMDPRKLSREDVMNLNDKTDRKALAAKVLL